MTAGRVVLDLVAPQSPSYRERGIARHGLHFANALVDRHPELIDRVLLHPELPPAGGLEHLIASGKAANNLDGIGPGGVYHVTSAFEPELGIRSLWPRVVSARRMRLAVTVYDLIPDIFPDMYLVDPGLRRRWRACRELARVADHVFALSDSGAEDVVRLLGVPEPRVSVIGAGCDERFRPPASLAAAGAQARAEVEGLGQHFIVYNGAIDPRKNLDRLLEAYAQLSPALIERYQLVLVCRAEPLQRNHYLVRSEALGLAGRVLLPGFVADDTLVALYQAADLSVFPSLYEGYGLPVIEAQACGAPVIAADNSSLRELVIAEARFDAADVADMAGAITRALTDDDLRARLLRQSQLAPPTWADAVDRAAAVYQELIERDRGRHVVPGWRTRPVVAVVSPLPPSPHPRAAYGEALASALEVAGAQVDRYAEGRLASAKGEAVPGQLPPGSLPRLDRWRGGYDLIVCVIGDDPALAGALGILARPDAAELPLVAIGQGIGLARGFDALAAADELSPDLATIVHRAYPGLPPSVGSSGRLDEATVDRYGLVMHRVVAAVARRYLVTTPGEAAAVRLDADPRHTERVSVVPPDGPDHFAVLAEDLLAAPRSLLSVAGS